MAPHLITTNCGPYKSLSFLVLTIDFFSSEVHTSPDKIIIILPPAKIYQLLIGQLAVCYSNFNESKTY